MRVQVVPPESDGAVLDIDAEATPAQKALSACGGALTTSLVVTPFDVVKTRQQRIHEQPGVQTAASETCCAEVAKRNGHARPPSMALCSDCPHPEVTHRGLSEAVGPKSAWPWRAPASVAASEGAASSLSVPQTMLRIVRDEGITSLWSGLRPALAMSVPATVLYMMAYEELRRKLHASSNATVSAWAPLLAGTSARAIAAAAVAPIELIRTQMQSGIWERGLGLIGGLRRTTAVHGVGGLYRGLVPTLFRDIPFSGLYWTLYESTKARVERAEVTPFVASFLSGASAGMVAACVTTPFDVVKTRMQIAIYSYNPATSAEAPLGPVETLRSIIRTEGASALASGMGARITKVAPACAIMISSYELGKRLAVRRSTTA